MEIRSVRASFILDVMQQPSNNGKVTADLFEPLLHARFRVVPYCFPEADGRTEQHGNDVEVVELELMEVKRLPVISDQGQQWQPFSLLFRGTHEHALASAMYSASHEGSPETQDVPLFLNVVQVSMAYHPQHHPEGRFYEAVIS